MKEEQQTKGAVILDIDGVVNSFSNKRFYIFLAYHSLHELAKVKSKKQLLCDLPKIKKMGGPNALFKFAREFCGNDETFNRYCHNLSLKLDYNLIKHDPLMKEFAGRLNSMADIVIRTDGLRDIATATWLRVIENRSSAEIKKNLIKDRVSKREEISLNGQTIRISDIVDNNFTTKAEGGESWQKFAENHRIDLSKSVLIDDSHNNCNVAEKIGMTTVHISKLDSFLQDVPFRVWYRSFSDVLGARMSNTLQNMRISYGQKVDIKQFFNQLLKTPLSKIKRGSHYSAEDHKTALSTPNTSRCIS